MGQIKNIKLRIVTDIKVLRTEDMEEGQVAVDKRCQFGSRYLTDETKVFEQNAWDNVEWSSEIEEEANEKIRTNSSITLSQSEIEKYDKEADKFWNAFYCQHQNKFFKDRNWLFTEFNELSPQKLEYSDSKSEEDNSTATENEVDGHSSTQTTKGSLSGTKIFEVGCGAGNTVFPILQANIDPNLFVYCCDFAESAVEIVKNHNLYDTSRCHAFVCDVASEDSVFPFPPNSLDFIVMIFVFSAIHPDRMQATLNRLTTMLKPGGMILFRDYGRYDMAQLRFKPGKCLKENFYVRGDGTQVYFFTQDEMHDMLTKCGLLKVQNMIDRRLQVNRGRQIKMYRVWIQCKYQKPLDA